jgi:hypothetical protein
MYTVDEAVIKKLLELDPSDKPRRHKKDVKIILIFF